MGFEAPNQRLDGNVYTARRNSTLKRHHDPTRLPSTKPFVPGGQKPKSCSDSRNCFVGSRVQGRAASAGTLPSGVYLSDSSWWGGEALGPTNKSREVKTLNGEAVGEFWALKAHL